MNRVLIHKEEVVEGGAVLLRGRRARHILDVLRAKPGKVIRVGIIDGPKGDASVIDTSAGAVALACTFEGAIPPTPSISLMLAIPRPKVLKRLYSQLSAMGIDTIFLTNAAKVDRNYFDTHWVLEENYRPLLLEGLEQSGETLLPRVEVVKRLKPFVEDTLPVRFADHSLFIAHPGCRTDWRSLQKPTGGRILLAVGPEGGWTEPELKMLDKAGFVQISLGSRTLRTDTACIALLAALQCFLTQA